MSEQALIVADQLDGLIFIVRGHRVMLSTHLADLYLVEAKVLTQAVKRNANRFPPDFMFQLSKNEFENLKSQFVTSSWGFRPFAPSGFGQCGFGSKVR